MNKGMALRCFGKYQMILNKLINISTRIKLVTHKLYVLERIKE